ncbi:unnamed protein product [Lasius platythorax]|uniref:Uncharacterized protein n=1 Tax=Lasius platythorax TaxID=488582 RepID=A0AAV2NLT7_9HYME
MCEDSEPYDIREHDPVVPPCERRGRRRAGRLRHGKCHPRGGRGAPTCAPSVGYRSRRLGVIIGEKEEEIEADARDQHLYNTLEKGATPGDTHVTLLMIGYLISVQEPSS